jgi:hypothetical protein
MHFGQSGGTLVSLGFSEVPEHTGLYFKNTVKWHKGYPENTVKGFSEVPEYTGLYFNGIRGTPKTQ